jgi:general secretion pathway protein A
MYKSFFGLTRNPFELSPDPSFMCSSGRSEQALASIYHAILQRKGFIVLTGEVGTGKTLVVRYLCDLWKDRRIPFANIIGPGLSVSDFLSYLIFDLGIEVIEPTKGNLLRAFYGFLLAQHEKGLTTVVVIDEAHQVPPAVLEEIRLLTNFETAQEKLLQVLLVGQPELDQKLDLFELRQLKQRVAIRCQLEPLGEEETRLYIERRLTLAGLNSQAATIFPAETVGAIYRYSSGVPRLVNSICEQAMIAAYARQIPVVPVEIIVEVASYFRLQPTADLGRRQESSLVGALGELASENILAARARRKCARRNNSRFKTAFEPREGTHSKASASHSGEQAGAFVHFNRLTGRCKAFGIGNHSHERFNHRYLHEGPGQRWSQVRRGSSCREEFEAPAEWEASRCRRCPAVCAGGGWNLFVSIRGHRECCWQACSRTRGATHSD